MRATLTVKSGLLVISLAVCAVGFARTGVGQTPAVEVANSSDWTVAAGSDAYCSYLGDAEDSTKSVCQGGAFCDCFGCRRQAYVRRVFASAEYLQWWNKARHLPPLLTTSWPIPAQDQAGVLDPGGAPTAITSIMVGDEGIGSGLQAGGRLTLGMWLDDCEDSAIAVRVFGVEGDSRSFSRQADGTTVLAVPFINRDPLVDAEDALLLSYPNLSEGSANISAENEIFGGQLFLRHLLDTGRDYRIDMLMGYRFTRVNDDLAMNFLTTDYAAEYDFTDVFRTRNAYHAGEIGLLGEFQLSNWTLSALGSVSFGTMEQRVTIQGENTVTAGVPVTRSGGVFSQPTNIGDYERNVTVWAPEAGIKLSYAVTDRFDISVGYTFLYWTSMALAGDQIDRNVNATQMIGGVLIGPELPEFQFKDTDFWVQSVDIGFSFNY